MTLSPKTGPQGPPAQVCLSDLIERKLAAMKDRQWRVSLGKKSIELREQIDRVLQIVIMAKDLGSSLASMDPIHAGIPWAGVCVLLPVRPLSKHYILASIDSRDTASFERQSAAHDSYQRTRKHCEVDTSVF